MPDLDAAYVTQKIPNAGAPVWVFIHGWGASANTWAPLLDELKPHCEIWLLDLPSFGENTLIANNPESIAADIAALLPEQSVVVGWSLGGMLLPLIANQLERHWPAKAIQYCISLAANAKFTQADNYPAAMPVATFQTFCDSFNASPAATWSRFGLLQAQGDGNRKSVSRQIKALHSGPLQAQNTHWALALSWLGEIDNRALLGQLSTPFLHVLGEADALVPSGAASALKHINPLHRVEILPAVGHVLHFSNPSLLTKTLLAQTCFAQDVHTNVNKCEKSKRNKARVAKSFSDAANQYDSVAHLQQKLANTLCDWVPEQCTALADLGCGTGYCGAQLQRARRNVYSLDLAEGMLQTARNKAVNANQFFAGVCADIETLPFADASFDALVSGMSMQWCEDLSAVFEEAYRVLMPGGDMVFSTLGPKTLFELREAWQQADLDLGREVKVHVNNFIDFNAVAAAAELAGFSVERHLVEVHVLNYNDVMPLMRELKTIGAHNVNPGQEKGLTGKARFNAMAAAYEAHRQADGRLPLTYEVGFYRLAKR